MYASEQWMLSGVIDEASCHLCAVSHLVAGWGWDQNWLAATENGSRITILFYIFLFVSIRKECVVALRTVIECAVRVEQQRISYIYMRNCIAENTLNWSIRPLNSGNIFTFIFHVFGWNIYLQLCAIINWTFDASNDFVGCFVGDMALGFPHRLQLVTFMNIWNFTSCRENRERSRIAFAKSHTWKCICMQWLHKYKLDRWWLSVSERC